VYLTLRARASYNILRAAYPDGEFRFLAIWGSYWAGYGFNNVIPARGGDVIRLFLTKTSIPGSSYSAVAAAFAVEAGFDLSIAVVVLTFAFTQGVFPKPPDFSKVNAVAAVVPFTPGGAGVQQALLVKVFATTAAADVVAAYSVGQQVAIAAFSFAVGFSALVFVFKIRSFKEVIRRGREDRAADKEAARRVPPDGAGAEAAS